MVVLEDHFTVKTLTLKVRNQEKELVDAEKPVFLCKNLPKFIATVMTERELESCTIKIGIDSGQGSFKICLTLLEAYADFMDLNVSLEYEKQIRIQLLQCKNHSSCKLRTQVFCGN